VRGSSGAASQREAPDPRGRAESSRNGNKRDREEGNKKQTTGKKREKGREGGKRRGKGIPGRGGGRDRASKARRKKKGGWVPGSAEERRGVFLRGGSTGLRTVDRVPGRNL